MCCLPSLIAYYAICSDTRAVKDITSRRLCASDFTTEKVIGRGAFGEVQLVSCCCLLVVVVVLVQQQNWRECVSGYLFRLYSF